MKEMFSFLNFLIVFYSISEGHYRLYHSYYPVMNNDHDCFYHYESNHNGLARHLVPYCIRYNPVSLNGKCWGSSFTFNQLRSNNISVENLWEWFAPVDLIDNYATYLSEEILDDQNEQSYCNCSDSFSFGTYCQYRFMLADRTSSFDEILHRSLLETKYDENNIYLMNENNSSTCYILFNCITHTGFCLDWREINDGFVHCTNGEDEKHFINLELNECNPKTEYRCRNGLCIPHSFFLDRTFDCPDRFDEQLHLDKHMEFITHTCSIDLSVAECEEYKLGLNSFSCGDGQYIPIGFTDVPSCSNLRNILLVKTIFRPYFYQIRSDPCYSRMLCVFRVLCLFEYCPQGSKRRCQELLSLDCPETFIFPPGPFVFPYVRLVYTSRMLGSITPEFLCWNRSIFNFTHKKSNVKIDGFHCMKAGFEYFANLLLSHKQDMYDETIILLLAIQRLFSDYTNQKEHKQLYKCLNSPLYISIYRIMDVYYSDCLPWSSFIEEEAHNEENRNLACPLPDRYPCDTGDTCIPRRYLGDGIIVCRQRDDEIFFIECTDELDCNYIRETNPFQRQHFQYGDVCDLIRHNSFAPIYITFNDTDETDCEMWPCKTSFNECDGLVQRPNACDEINCGVPRRQLCTNDEYPCAHINSTAMSCLPLSKVGNKQFDCLFGVDESTTLLKKEFDTLFDYNTKKYESHEYFRIPCWNHFNITLKPNQICDRIIDCPLNDDESFCYWLLHSICDRSKEFTCKNGTCISKMHQWCNGIIDCYPDGEDERFCYLLKPYSYGRTNARRFLDSYPPLSFDRFTPFDQRRRRRQSNLNTPHCHQGILVYNKFDDINECLCPPSYYGSYCQWQSERLTIFYRVNLPSLLNQHSIYWIVFYLLDESNEVLTHETMIYTMSHEYSSYKQLIYLNYRRLIQPSAQFNDKFVPIHVYRVTNFSIELTSYSWSYSVQFSSFLPVTRLSTILSFEEATKNQTRVCHEFNSCKHGICEIYLNTGNPFCRCEQDWFGELCDKKQSKDPCQAIKCNPRFGKCIIYNNHAFCLCFLGQIGPKCQVAYDACSTIKCQNNGTCKSFDQRTVSYVCICPMGYFGNLCQHASAQIKIKIPSHISNNTIIPLVTIYFLVAPNNTPGALLHQDYYFYRNVYPNGELTVYENNQIFLSPIILAQLHFNSSSIYGSYYLLGLSNIKRTHLTTQVQELYHCPPATDYLNSSLINASWLKRIKFYPYYLKHTKCFYDEIYMCLVDKYEFPNCLFYHHYEINCTTKNLCVNNGLCLQNKRMGRNEFICICPECTTGEFCQIQLTKFSITLDSVLAQIIHTDVSLNNQPIAITILLVFISLMLFIGFVSNILSFQVFRHEEIRQIGCGYYLTASSIMNQITITVFCARVIFLIISQIVIINNETFLKLNCHTFDFLLQVCISFCNWLHTCIACERTISAWKGALFNRRLSTNMVKFILIILSILVVLTSLHQIFTHDLTEDPKSNLRLWCVIKYSRPWLSTYDTVINIVNNFVPFSMNFTCGIILLITLTINRKRVAKKEDYTTIFFSQTKQHKDLLIAPLIMIIAKIPLIVVSVSIKCMNKQWHTYVSLFAYCISLLPFVTTFMNFVWPSDSYMKKFKEKFPIFKRL